MNKNNLYWKVALVAGLALLLILADIKPGWAFEARSGREVVLPAGEIVADDLYVAGNTITIDGLVRGDLIAAGNTIIINGSIEGDLISVGQVIRLNGQVTDDVRLAAAALVLGRNTYVTDDLIAVGYSLEMIEGAVVLGDLVYAGSQMLLAGNIAGNVVTNVRGLELRGAVSGDVRASVGTPQDTPGFSPLIFLPNAPATPDVPGGLTLGNQAMVEGNLIYSSTEPLELPQETVAGEIIYQRRAATTNPEEIDESTIFGTRAWFLRHFRNLIASLLVALILVRVTPNLVQRSAAALHYKPLQSLLWGVASFLGIFVAIIIVLTVMILLALMLGWATLNSLAWMVVALGLLIIFTLVVLFSFAAGYAAEIIVAYLGGRLILARVNPNWARDRYASLVLGVTLLVALTAIPYVGEVIHLLAILFGLGAFWVLEQEILPPHLLV